MKIRHSIAIITWLSCFVHINVAITNKSKRQLIDFCTGLVAGLTQKKIYHLLDLRAQQIAASHGHSPNPRLTNVEITYSLGKKTYMIYPFSEKISALDAWGYISLWITYRKGTVIRPYIATMYSALDHNYEDQQTDEDEAPQTWWPYRLGYISAFTISSTIKWLSSPFMPLSRTIMKNTENK